MAKKKTEKPILDKNDSIEKMRDELFQYRVEICSYKRSMNYLIAFVSVIIAVLGFFGYDKIDTVADKFEEHASNRLAVTDSILAKLDTHFLDSITDLIYKTTNVYENSLKTLEKGVQYNIDYVNLIGKLSYNKRAEKVPETYFERNATNVFDIAYYSDSIREDIIGECYVIMRDEYKYNTDDVFLIAVYPKGRNIAVFYQPFVVKNDYNKFYFQFNKYEDDENYRLEVVLLKKQGNGAIGYRIKKPVVLY